MQVYRHRQVGTLSLFVLGFGALLSGAVLIFEPARPLMAGLALVTLLLCILLFWSLTVEVTADKLTVSFGPGVIRKSFQVEDIHNVRVVRNSWWYGWGIRLTPHGWLFNVSGFDAVELELKNNRKFRIGTDDPQQLLTAIRRVSQPDS